ncbi:MAG: hypothetical protein HY788_17555 [Deltaproteobacteria bacterium]|nr:hypothetical protein [Deltaproteobacteria bacterium]
MKNRKYDYIDRIPDRRDLGVNLGLALRRDLDYYTQTWRQLRPPDKKRNRWLYFEKGNFWAMPADAGLEMMEDGKAANFFSVKYSRWPGKSIVCRDSNRLSAKDAKELFREALTSEIIDEVWRKCQDLRVVACREPWDQEWLKVMIVSPSANELTFRSLTREKTYRFKHRPDKIPFSNGWMLDRSMMDADGRISQIMMERLKEALRG